MNALGSFGLGNIIGISPALPAPEWTEPDRIQIIEREVPVEVERLIELEAYEWKALVFELAGRLWAALRRPLW